MNSTARNDFCYEATEAQSVPLYDTAKDYFLNKGEFFDETDLINYRRNFLYTCNDDYVNGNIQDDNIFISTTDNQHAQIIDGKAPTSDGGISGYFSDQDTVNQCITRNQLDNSKFNQLLQIMPFNKKDGSLPVYKPHVDCFFIDKDQLLKLGKELSKTDYGKYIVDLAKGKME